MTLNEAEFIVEIFEIEELYKTDIRFDKINGQRANLNMQTGLVSIALSGHGAKWLIQVFIFCIDSHILKHILSFNLLEFQSNIKKRDQK